MKDLLIGAVDNYSFDKVKVWARSIKETGFDGDVVLIVYRADELFFHECTKHGIITYHVEYDSLGQPIQHNIRGRDTQCHQLRFFHIWQFLYAENNYLNYRNVIITDVRDVYFQRNPSIYLRTFSDMTAQGLIFASSESMYFKDEPWNMDNLYQGFGPLVASAAADWEIYNVGVLGGAARDIMPLCLELFNMTVGRYIPSDQSAFNIIANLNRHILPITHNSAWACQCGTTLDPEKAHYASKLLAPCPKIENNVVMTGENDGVFYIIHQWDRVPALKQYLEEKYRD